MTIHDISKLAKVSVATVSRVLNGNANVSDKTREKVMAVIREKNYTPNAFARGLGLDTMRTVGILCVDPADPEACPSLQFAIGYIQRELRRQNFDSLLYCIGYDMEEKEHSIQAMLERRVDAIIMIGSFFIESNAASNMCIVRAAQTTPIWLVNGRLNNVPNVYSVCCDDLDGGYQATQALIHSGSRNILFLHQGDTYSEIRKKQGYAQALAENGIPLQEEFLCECTPDLQEISEKLSAITSGEICFDGVFATEDELGAGALKWALAHGIKVPETMRVVGYSNLKLDLFTTPELASVDQNIESLCITAVTLLIHQLRGTKVAPTTVLASELIYRESLGIDEI